jgi:hypothetical protein
MNWLTIMLIAGVVILLIGLFTEVDIHEAVVVTAAFMVGLSLLGLGIAGLSVWDFAPSMARMQEVRSAVERLPCTSSFSASKIYGDAVDWNQEVRSNRLWNQRWVTDPFIADGWDTVSVIIIPSCKE